MLFVIGTCFFGFYSLLGIDLHHDGIMFKAAVDAANGKAIFSGTFSQYGVLPALLQGLFIKIFGAELLVLKLLTAVFYGASLVVYDMIWKRFFPKKEWYYRAACIVMYFMLSSDCCVTAHPWASVYALFFLLLAIYFTLRFLDDTCKNTWFALAAGVCAGLMFGLRQPCGLTAFLSAGALAFVTLAYDRKVSWRFAALFFSGAAACLLIYACLITYQGAWSDYITQTWTHAFSFAVKRGSGDGKYSEMMINFFPFITGDRGFVDAVFAFFPLLTLGLLGYFFWLGKWKNELPMVSVILYALGAWHQYYPVPCMRHLYWAAVPMMGVFVYVIRKLISEGGIRGRIGAAVLVAILLFPMGFRGYFSAKRVYTASKRAWGTVPGVRGLLLFEHEKKMTELLYEINSLMPEELKKRGVMNHTPDGIWSVMFPECGFAHPQFCRLGTTIYPDYDRKVYRYCLENRPVIISSVWHTMPGYMMIRSLSYQGVNYFVLFPEK